MTVEEAKKYIAGRIDDNDYVSIGKFYRQLTAKDDAQREQFDNIAEQLEEKGAIIQSVLSKAKDPNTAAQLSFAIKQSAGIADNSAYGKEYSKKLNYTNDETTFGGLFGTDIHKKGARINKVEFMLSPEDYEEFKNTSGLNFKYFDKNNLTSPYIQNCTSDGVKDFAKFGGSQYIKLTIPTEAYKDVDMFNKVNVTLQNMYSKRNIMAGGINALALATISSRTKKSWYACYDDKGQLVEDGNGIPKSHRQALSMSKPAMDTLKGLSDSLYEYNGVFDIQTSGYSCEAQMEVMNARRRGEMDDSHANALLNDINSIFDNSLMTDGLGSYNVYATTENPSTMNFTLMEDTEKKTDLVNKLRSAIEKKRVTYVAADAGGKLGTYITITNDPDSKGTQGENYKAARYIFVEGLFADEAKKLINNDIKAKSKHEYYNHVTYGHDYNTPDGGKITNITSKGGIYVNGDYRKELDGDEVKQRIKEGTLIKETAKVLKKDFGYNNIYNPEVRQSEEFRKSLTEYATRLYAYVNNITDTDTLQKPYVQDEITGIIANIVNYIYNNK